MSRSMVWIVSGIGLAAVALWATQVARCATIASQIYTIDDNCRIVTAANKQGTSADLKVGDKVTIGYRSQNGTLVAGSIVVQRTHTARQSKPAPPSSRPKPQQPGPAYRLRTRGTIININPQANTVTIEGKPARRE
jgi:hypothetical protein